MVRDAYCSACFQPLEEILVTHTSEQGSKENSTSGGDALAHRSPLVGYLYTACGCLLLTGATLSVLGVLIMCEYMPVKVALMLWAAVASPVYYAGYSCYVYGKKLRTVAAHDALRADNRAPILYLRSFDHDGTTLPGRATGEPLFMTLEERISRSLGSLGPFVAIGKPGESLPELGAARMYVEDNDWQKAVDGLVAQAQLVVIRVGTSKGVQWEIQTALRNVAPERLIFFFGYGFDDTASQVNESLSKRLRRFAQRHLTSFQVFFPNVGCSNRQLQYNIFRELTNNCFCPPLPETIGHAFFLYFDSQWNAFFYDFHLPKIYGVSFRSVREPEVPDEFLRTVLRRLHRNFAALKPISEWERNACHVVLVGLVILLVCVILFYKYYL
jgi:hypothetical protein